MSDAACPGGPTNTCSSARQVINPWPMILPLTFKKNDSHASPGFSRLMSFVVKFCRNEARSRPLIAMADQSASRYTPRPDRNASCNGSETPCVSPGMFGLAVFTRFGHAYHRVLGIFDDGEALGPGG